MDEDIVERLLHRAWPDTLRCTLDEATDDLRNAAAEIDRLRAELADVVSQWRVCAQANTDLENDNAAKDARIAELEYKEKRFGEARAQQPDWEKLWEEATDRAERAEAERDALREALEFAQAAVDQIGNPLIRTHLVAVISAALNPSPVGREE